MGEFEGKVAIVTGGASGIGAAVVRELAAGGAKVVVADMDEAGAIALAGEVGGKPFAIDVTDPEAVRAMVEFAEGEFGALHLAVNNAGISGKDPRPTGEYSIDTWNRVIGVNLNSVFYCLRHELPAIERAGGGAIVNMASILSSVGTAGNPDYVAAKHGVIGLTKAAALEYATRGIRINAVGPGYIETPLLAHMDEKVHRHLVSLHPMGRLGKAEEVAALTCFLLSGRASFITGSYHLVDGGYTAP